MKRKVVKQIAFTFYPEAVLDYHELGILTAYDIEKYLIEFITDTYHANLHKILVITGKGSVVKPTVYRLLKKNNLIKNFKLAEAYNGGDGAYEIEF